MPITQINDYSIGDSNLNGIMTSLDNTYKGKNEITLSNYANDAAPSVKVGSVFENNGALFVVDSGDITPAGYVSIPVSTPFYLYLDFDTVTPANSTFIYSATVPVWNDALQGWYNGNDRAFFSMYKDSGGTLYENKVLLENKSLLPNKQIRLIGTTQQIIFSSISQWVPKIGDILSCEGQFYSAPGSLNKGYIDGIIRTSTTNIQLLYAQSNAVSSQQAISSLSNNPIQEINIKSRYQAITTT